MRHNPNPKNVVVMAPRCSVLTQLAAVLAVVVLVLCGGHVDAQQTETVMVDWSDVLRVSKTSTTLQVVVNPLLRRSSPIHDQAFASLKGLPAEYIRYVPWLPYPKLGVAELGMHRKLTSKPPTHTI